MIRAGGIVLAGCILAALGARTETGAAETGATLPLVAQTVADAPLIRRTPYNYAPSIIHDGALYHLYWCAGDGGDVIMHLQAASLAGPWRAASFWSRRDVVLRPTGSAADFDGLHTCDPNVLEIGGTFYLYYTGEAKDGALSAVGVAASRDGIHYQRVGDGAIAVASEGNPSWRAGGLTYGAGQPAATYVAPWIYLSFTDSTGAGGDGQYMLRAKDPSFRRDVQEWTATGWTPLARPRSRSGTRTWLDSYGLDLMYDPPSRMLLAVTDRLAGSATLLAIDPATLASRAAGALDLAWREGPSFVAEANKASAPRKTCDDIEVAVAAAAGASDSPLSWKTIAYSDGLFSLASICPH